MVRVMAILAVEFSKEVKKNLLFSLLALTALKSVIPGFSKARLRNFGMTIGTRDSRKIVGR